MALSGMRFRADALIMVKHTRSADDHCPSPVQRANWIRWGATIKQAATAKGYVARELAEALGLARSTVHAFWVGKRGPSFAQRQQICKLLDIPPAKLAATLPHCPTCGYHFR
jgi:DNA-binding XRE family transcriptional regulator